MAEEFQYAPIPKREESVDTSLFSVLGAGFTLENDVVNAYEYVTRDPIEPDVDFNFQTAMAESLVDESYGPQLAEAKSQKHFNDIQARIKKEEEARRIIEAAGWGGFAAAMAAGTLSPTMFIPLVGQARGLKGVAQTLSLAGSASAAQELTLYATQETRTLEEVGFGIAAGTILGGLMGTTYKALTPDVRAKLAQDFEAKIGKTDVEIRDPETGKVTVTRLNDGIDLPDHLVSKVTTKLPTGEEIVTKKTVTLDQNTYDEIIELIGMEEDTNLEDLELFARDHGIDEIHVKASELPEDSGIGGGDDFVIYADEKTKELNGLLAKEKRNEELTPVEREKLTELKEFAESIPRKNPTGRNVQGLQQPTTRAGQKLFNQLTKLNPVTRQLGNRYLESARYWASRFQLPGVRLANTKEFGVNAKDGTLQARREIHDGALANFIQEFDDAYYRHLYGNLHPDEDLRKSYLGQLRAGILSPPPGKLRPKEFSIAAYDELSSGVKATNDSTVTRAADSLSRFFKYFDDVHEEYLAEFRLDEGEDFRPLYTKGQENALGPGVENYAHQMPDPRIIQDNTAEFIRDLTEHGLNMQNEAFAKAWGKYKKRANALDDTIRLTEMDEDQLDDVFDFIEGEIVDIESNPDYNIPHSIFLKGMKDIKELGLEKAEAQEARRELRESLPSTYHELKKQRAKLATTRGLVGKLGARNTEKYAEMSEKVAKLEELQMKEFEVVHKHLTQFDKKAKKLSPENMQKAVDKEFSAMEKSLRALAKKQKTLYSDYRASDPDVASKRFENVQKAETRLNNIIERVEAAEQNKADAPMKLAIMADAREMLLYERMQLNAKRALRTEDALEKLEKLEPEALGKFREEERVRLREKREELEDTFFTKWSERGADDIDLEEGIADFTISAEDDAVNMHRLLTGNRDRAVDVILTAERRGAQLKRVWNIPYDVKKKYLNRDAEYVARSFTRTMAPDLELWRATKSVNGSTIYREISEEVGRLKLALSNATYVRIKKGGIADIDKFLSKTEAERREVRGTDFFLSLKDFDNAPEEGFEELTPELSRKLGDLITAQEKYALDDFQTMIEIFRNERGRPENPDGFGYRLGKSTMAMNTMVMMGKVMVSSFPDIARPIFRYGVRKTFAKAWKPYVGFFTGDEFTKHAKAQNRRLALALDPILHNRLRAVADTIFDQEGRMTVAEKGLQFGARKMGAIALYDFWTAANKHVAAAVVHASFAEYLPTAVLKKGSAKEIKIAEDFLHRLNISDDMAKKIYDQFQLPNGSTEFKGGLRLPNVEHWEDMKAYRAYAAAMHQEVNDLIVTPGLDMPSVASQNLAYRMLFQFKSFTFASTNRIVLSNLQGNDPYLIQGWALSLAMGALSYYTWAIATSDKEYEKMKNASIEKWIYEAFDRGGLDGVFSWGRRVGEQLPWAKDLLTLGSDESTSRRASSGVEAIIGPSLTQLTRAVNIAKNIDEPTRSTLHQLRVGFLPFQNLFYLDRALDKFEEALGGMMELPERRGQN